MKSNIEKLKELVSSLSLDYIKKYFSYDLQISVYFLEQYQKGLRVFFMVGVISYTTYAIFDCMQGYILLIVLRLLIIFLCFLPIFVYIKKLGFTKMKYISNLSLFLILILEMETQMQAPDVPFYHTSTWFVDILIILVHAMYFQGTPLQYSLYWFILIIYYCFRCYIKVNGNINSVIVNVWMYHLEAWLFGTVFNFWWFQIRYERTLADIRLKEEYEKRISIEKELSRVKEREAIFTDIHDNLGGKLLDLSLQLNQIDENIPISSQLKVKIDKTLSEVLKGLRNRLLVFEDMTKIERNFVEGLELFLVRRYSFAERRIEFTKNDPIQKGLIQKEKIPLLINIITELVNNDLKYGFGISKWNISLIKNSIYLEMESNTNWNPSLNKTRNGYSTIRKRLEILNASYTEDLNEASYRFSIHLGANNY